jgi:tetratricopeptide (TPR) repeat protein
MREQDGATLAPEEFFFYRPPTGMTLNTGKDPEVQVPAVPLPIQLTAGEQDPPSEKVIGDSLYTYLCRFPECEYAGKYADILQQAFPFLISDIGSQLILLDMKGLDADGLKRKTALLRILIYLEPDNFGLLHKLGRAHYDLALIYSELSQARFQLKEARSWLEKARRVDPTDAGNLNVLGQVCYLNGSYHQAKLYWQIALDQLTDETRQKDLSAKLARIAAHNVPTQPLIDSLEQLAQAKEFADAADFSKALEIFEQLEAHGDLGRELPNPEFYFLLGHCREHCNDLSGAFESYSTALTLDKKYLAAERGLERITAKTSGEE